MLALDTTGENELGLHLHPYKREQEEVAVRKVEYLRIALAHENNNEVRIERHTIGHLNFFFPEIKSQSKLSDVTNSQLHGNMDIQRSTATLADTVRIEDEKRVYSHVYPQEGVHEAVKGLWEMKSGAAR